MKYRLKEPYQTSWDWSPKVITAPKGCEVRPAHNLPASDPPRYWIQPWPGMSEEARSWCEVYGWAVPSEIVELVPSE